MKTVKIKSCKEGYLLGYWKGERVALIPQYHPESKPGEYVIEEIEVPSNHTFPRVIDPNETTLSEIKEICEFNDLPLSWIIGMSPKDRAIQITGDSLLQKGIEYFITFKTAGTTAVQYRTRAFS